MCPPYVTPEMTNPYNETLRIWLWSKYAVVVWISAVAFIFTLQASVAMATSQCNNKEPPAQVRVLMTEPNEPQLIHSLA